MGDGGVLARADALSDQASSFVVSSVAENTQTAYESDWRSFTRWCQTRGAVPLPAEPVTVANYLADQATSLKPATLDRRVAAINKVHTLRGITPPGADPVVRTVLAGIHREKGTRPRRMTPLLMDDLRVVLGALDFEHYPAAIAARRDACLLLFGFAGAFRRSELAALLPADVTMVLSDGLHVLVERSKTDQEGTGLVKALPYGTSPVTCPVCAYRRWMQLLSAPHRSVVLRLIANPAHGHVCRDEPLPLPDDVLNQPLFPPVDRHGTIGHGWRLSGQGVAAVVQRRLAAVRGGDSRGYGAHSLRAGFVTEALRAGATGHQVMRQTGMRSPGTVAVYGREQAPLRGNAVTKVGL